MWSAAKGLIPLQAIRPLWPRLLEKIPSWLRDPVSAAAPFELQPPPSCP